VRIVRYASALLLAAIAAFLAVAAAGALSNLFAEYKDSSDAVYIGFGVGYLAVAVLFAAAALQTVSQARHPVRWLALTLAAVVCSAFPYAVVVGWPAYALNTALALLALGSAAAYLRSPARM
jgi:hypothetical protein